MKLYTCVRISLFGAMSVSAPMAWSSQVEDTLPEVTVSAQRFEQNLQDVPVTVTALDSAALDVFGVVELKDISQRVPNLVLSSGSSQPTSVRAFMRGAGSNDSVTATAEQAIGFYVDDVYQARGAGLNLDFPDLDRIEVLRGPQGTLYGRNTMVGAI